MDTKSLLTVKEAGKLLGVSALTLRNWDKKGKLKAMRHPLNNYRVYKLADIEKLLQSMENGEKPIYIPRREKKVKKLSVRHEE